MFESVKLCVILKYVIIKLLTVNSKITSATSWKAATTD